MEVCGDDAGKDNAGRHKSKHISRSRWTHTAGCGLSLGAIPRPELRSEHMPANGGPCGTYRMVSAMSSTFPGSGSVGRVIDGRFRLVHWLGGTEHSSVYLTLIAGDPPRSAAVKLVPADDVRGPQWAAARVLSHPHLMRLFQFGRCEFDGNELLYAVTEYAEEILSDVVAERPLTAAETREMLPSIMDALSYLHGRGLVHGALAPSNIMAVGDRLKLSVDGLQSAGEPWRRNRLIHDYDAPEIATEMMSPAMDVWSLGIVLAKALTQETPAWNWEGRGQPVVPTSVPEPFYGIARECLRVDPSRRITLANIKARLAPGARRAPAAHLAPAPAIVPANKGTEKTRFASNVDDCGFRGAGCGRGDCSSGVEFAPSCPTIACGRDGEFRSSACHTGRAVTGCGTTGRWGGCREGSCDSPGDARGATRRDGDHSRAFQGDDSRGS